jgi:hypothetical protein
VVAGGSDFWYAALARHAAAKVTAASYGFHARIIRVGWAVRNAWSM